MAANIDTLYSQGASPYDPARQRAGQRADVNTQQNIEAMQRRYAAMGGLNSGSAISAQTQAQQVGNQQKEDAIRGIDAEETGNAIQRNFAANQNADNRGFQANFQAGESQKARDFAGNQFQQTLAFNKERAMEAQKNKLRELDQRDQEFAQGIDREKYNENQNDSFFSNRNTGKMVGGLIGQGSGAGMAALFSDENLKENISDCSDELTDFLSHVKAKSFNYKGDDKTHFGIMAQDLEEHPIGRSMVVDTPQGKMVDLGHGFAALLAAQSVLNERIAKLEGK